MILQYIVLTAIIIVMGLLAFAPLILSSDLEDEDAERKREDQPL